MKNVSGCDNMDDNSISITSEIIDHVISERTEIFREGICMFDAKGDDRSFGEGWKNGYLVGKLDALNKIEDMIGKNKFDPLIIKEITDMIERMSALKRKIESARRNDIPPGEHMHEQIVAHFESNLKNLDQYHFTEEDDRYHLGHVDGRRQEIRGAIFFMQSMEK